MDVGAIQCRVQNGLLTKILVIKYIVFSVVFCPTPNFRSLTVMNTFFFQNGQAKS